MRMMPIGTVIGATLKRFKFPEVNLSLFALALLHGEIGPCDLLWPFLDRSRPTSEPKEDSKPRFISVGRAPGCLGLCQVRSAGWDHDPPEGCVCASGVDL